MLEKCILFHEKCAVKPGGFETACFGHCEDAKYFLQKYKLTSKYELKIKVIEYLEEEIKEVKSWLTEDKIEVMAGLRTVIEFLKE